MKWLSFRSALVLLTCSAVAAACDEGRGGSGGGSEEGSGGDGSEVQAPPFRTLAPGPNTELCGILGDGRLFCAEALDVGARGSADQTNAWRQIGGDTDLWTWITIGGDHACGIRSPGTLWCWGNNEFNQLGTVTPDKVSAKPVQVGHDRDWITVEATRSTTCGVRANGAAECWGRMAEHDFEHLPGAWKRLSSGPHDLAMCGVLLKSAISPGDACDDVGTCDLGTLYCWDSSAPELLAYTGSMDNEGFGQADGQNWTLVSVRAQRGLGVTTCALRSNGALYCFGENFDGQTGAGHFEPVFRLTQIGGVFDWTSVAVGDGNTCATRADGSLWCWGDLENWRLDGIHFSNVPVRIRESGWSAVMAGHGEYFGRRGDHTMWSLGFSGPLDGSKDHALVPAR
jgi:hypothetical protein